MRDDKSLIERICGLSHLAGEKIMRFYHQETAVIIKKDSSPLTAADSASHEFLTESLRTLLPEVPVNSEESANNDWQQPADARYWLVDPLDGTKEFLKRTNEFTVNIALVEDGRLVLGVVYAPALDITYYAGTGVGAWRQQGNLQAQPIAVRRADVSRLSVVASKDHAGPLVQAMLAQLPGAELKSMGSSLKFCLVAEGKADLYLRDLPTMEWDTAAAQCIVENAGGGVYDLSGVPLRYGKPDLRNGSIMTVGDLDFPWQTYVGSSTHS
jgi:3'(2'), 5'-bisphosphate nucleotidase